ncbi:MAG: hypothetical protein IKE51_01940 [Solobacterium sp.]|nr:hypothetical protein [Solobacterium sp.]
MRNILLLNDDWYFTKENTFPNEIKEDYEKIQIPHTWNAIDGQDGGNDYYRGTCYYLKKFHKDCIEYDECYLELEGVNASGDVYLNGKHLKHHDGGYSTWRVDLTDALEEENLLVVQVDNSINEIVYPQMADFTFYGGIYRNVKLIGVNKTHFDLDYYGGPGIQVTPTVKEDYAEIHIQVYVKNLKPEHRIVYTLMDQESIIEEVSTDTLETTIHLPHPHLWNGVKDPYLYLVKATLLEDNLPIDEIQTKTGIRFYEIDSERGFLLNGNEYPLRGVARHQDFKGVGNAISESMQRMDMELIHEMGANTIRLAHYQHSQTFYDLCDEYGMIVWTEIPYISKHMPTANENTKSQMKELIIQNYNHPSIVVWGLSNEITVSGNVTEDLLNNHIELNDLAHSLDSSRLTTMACVSMLDIHSPLLKVPDVLSYNHYFGWYGGSTDQNGPWFDHFHEVNPTIPIGMSEYGCEALNWHTSSPKQGDYTEEYQAYYHEELIKQISERKYLWATHVWNMFDFGADARAEGGENGQNHKGLVTFDRLYKKDSFYAYKAWLSDEKFVHLCGKRYVDRVEDTTRITVYSNLDEVQLYLNDELYETKKGKWFFYFEIPNQDTTYIKAKAGEYEDESMIRKVETFNEAYTYKEAGAVLNWFDIAEVEGYYSLNDTVGDILKSPQGQQLMQQMLGNVASSHTGGFELGPEAMQMMNGFTVVRLVNMMSSMANLNIPKEKLLEINELLNQIPKNKS